jgi:hypothetical protein
MKILLAIDGSPCSQAAIDEVCARTLHAPCSVEIVRRRHLHEESSS